ncbi:MULTISPECIES: DMT family transporter [Bacillales]|uniref:DMT family transporter n=1 Tax=Bacillales TaxID=1385 RepID=UPI00096D3590|nr:multidrug efflux SMR transporter [Paenibacillus sp. FSL R5-0490]OMF56828.1 QacE family quaternary ammonium compound efflux SMR transporter [Paenibacillus sp. FSL R5-0490]
MRGYVFLTISIAGEIFATTMLKLSDGLTVLLPTAGVVFGYALSFYCLSLCLKTVPLSLAYAIWSGAGTALTALIGAIIWEEAFSTLKIAGILLIIGGIFLLNSSHSTGTAKEPSR